MRTWRFVPKTFQSPNPNLRWAGVNQSEFYFWNPYCDIQKDGCCIWLQAARYFWPGFILLIMLVYNTYTCVIKLVHVYQKSTEPKFLDLVRNIKNILLQNIMSQIDINEYFVVPQS